MPIIIPIEGQDRFSKVFESVKRSVDETSKAVGNLGGDAGSVFSSMAMQAEAASRSTSALSEAFGDFFKQYTAANIALQGFFKVKQALGDATDTIRDFQSQQSMLGAILGETTDGIKEMTEQAKDLGRTTVFTASQVSQLQIELSKLGFEKKAIEDMTESILQFAQATGGDLGDAAALTGAAVRMFGAQTEEANRYTNAMARATTASALSFQAIRDNLATFGPMAHSLGLEIEDVLALFGTLKNAGVEGSTAMTSLRNIFTKVAQGKVPGMEGGIKTLDEFISKLKQINDMSPGDAMKKIGTRGGTQFMTLMQQADQVLELRDKIKQASEEDTTGGMAEQMTNNVAGAIKMMESAWEGFVLSFSESTGPWKYVIDQITSGITGLTNLIATGSTINKEALYAVMTGLGSLITMYGVKNGVIAVTNQLTAAQTAQYMRMAEALEMANNAESTGYRIELQSAVSKGILTKEQAAKITMLLAEADAQEVRMQKEREAIATQLAQEVANEEYAASMLSVGAAEEKVFYEEMRLDAQRKKGILTTRLASADTNLEALAHQKDAMAKLMNVGATSKLKIAMDMLGFSLLTNPYILAAAAIAGVAYAIYSITDAAVDAEKAQTMLNDAMERQHKTLEEEKNKAQQDLKVLQDKNTTLREQYKAYQDLIKVQALFSRYSQDEIKKMSKEQFDALISQGSEERESELAENRVAAYKEAYEKYKYTNGFAWNVTGENKYLEQLQEKYNLGTELTDSYGAASNWTRVNEYFKEMYNAAKQNLSQYLKDGAVAGLSEGLSQASKDVREKAQTLVDEFGKSLEGAGSKSAASIGRTFSSQVSPQLEESKKRAEELNNELLYATGDKKIKIQSELDQTNVDIEVLQSLIDLFRSGNDKELVVKIRQEFEDNAAGADFLINLGEEYEKAETFASDYLTKIEQMQDKLQGLGVVTQEDFAKIKEEFGLTQEDIDNGIGALGEKARKELNDLSKKYDNTKDTIERNKLKVQIEKKKELINYIDTVQSKLNLISKKTFSAKFDVILGKVAPQLRCLLGESVLGTLFDFSGQQELEKVKKGANKAKASAASAKDEKKAKEDEDKKKKAEEAAKKKEEDEKAAKKAAEEKKKQREYEELVKKQKRERIRAEIDMEHSTRQAQINAMNEGTEKSLKQIELDYDKQMEAIKRKNEDLAQKKIDQAKALFEKNPANKNKVFDPATVNTAWTPEERENYYAQITEAQEKRKKALENIVKEERKAWTELYKEYGDYEQKRLAITQDYERRISEAKTTAEKASLRIGMANELESLEKSENEKKIDLSGAFTELQGLSVEYLKSLRQQLQDLLSSGEITDLTQLDTIQKKIREINSIISEQSVSWKDIDSLQRLHKERLDELKDAQERLNQATLNENAASANVNLVKGELARLTGKKVSEITSDMTNPFAAGTAEYKQMEKLLVDLAAKEAKLGKAREETAKATSDATRAEEKSRRSILKTISDAFDHVIKAYDKYGIGQIGELVKEMGFGDAGDKIQSGLDAFESASGAYEDFM